LATVIIVRTKEAKQGRRTVEAARGSHAAVRLGDWVWDFGDNYTEDPWSWKKSHWRIIPWKDFQNRFTPDEIIEEYPIRASDDDVGKAIVQVVTEHETDKYDPVTGNCVVQVGRILEVVGRKPMPSITDPVNIPYPTDLTGTPNVPGTPISASPGTGTGGGS
jgi:hypothetical protein